MGQTTTSETGRAWLFVKSIVLGGIAGAVGIVVAVIAELDWECRYRNRGCNDGQGGIVLVVLVPMMFLVGTLLGSVWAWLRIRLPPSSILSQSYTGTQKVQSQIMAWLSPLLLWSISCFGLVLLLLFWIGFEFRFPAFTLGRLPRKSVF
jgi:hypothetical protein